MRAAVLTVSTSKAAGEGEDESGPALAEYAEGLGLEVEATEVIDDDQDLIAERLRYWCDDAGCELVLTTGGTGMAPTDVTPEAIRAVIEREAPGIAEAMRIESREHTPNWMLSRGVAGTRGSTLIVSFPGSPKSIAQAGAAIAQALPHALKLLAGENPH
jgi:molybdenum cofactor synthesis domain-containing protein